MKKVIFILGFIAFSCASFANNGIIDPTKAKQNNNLIIKKNVVTLSENVFNMTTTTIQISDDVWICCGSVQLSNGSVLTNCVGAATRDQGDDFILNWMMQF